MENKKSKKPFFASFLEKQIQDPEKIKGGSGIVKSAAEDNITAVLKDTVTAPNLDAVTMRYPSDSDAAEDLD
ncbi:microviridin/marinostatin family tricyclic proteinase inhibitor [uncultured Chryseobacterium sp.]|uniref:microviridin/marinostatin family tricyclic proteinase inhibitor n=1 Tax=uncultured Chryseobacterium sp. TaxID=259322 RepID=UPI0025F162B9|nr:microviridin/marinostatin family tricyclic proteinase inhibitor [uncultured Chryseobacterium sp.]